MSRQDTRLLFRVFAGLTRNPMLSSAYGQDEVPGQARQDTGNVYASCLDLLSFAVGGLPPRCLTSFRLRLICLFLLIFDQSFGLAL